MSRVHSVQNRLSRCARRWRARQNRCRAPKPGPVSLARFVDRSKGSSWRSSCRSTAARQSPTPSGIKRVAERIVDARKAGHDVVVVVSAMGDTTDELLDLAEQVVPAAAGRELDMLLTAGERISMALLAMAIHNLGVRGPLVHRLAGRRDHHVRRTAGRASSTSRPGGSRRARRGRDRDRRRLPGRVARTPRTSPRSAAAAPTPPRWRWPPRSSADVCEIYTDVDGVFTADPRIVPARPAHRARSPTRRCWSWPRAGRRCCTLRCVEYARRFDVPIHVRSSLLDQARHRWSTGIDGGSSRGASPHHRRRARPQRGEDHHRRRARRARRGGAHLRDRGRRRDQHRHDRAERLDRGHRPHRHLVHAAARPTARPRWRRWTRSRKAVGFKTPALRRPHRQGVADRRRHALAPRRGGEVLRRARRGRRQHRDDLHVGDPGLGGLPRHRPRRRGPRRARRVRARRRPRSEAVVYGGTGR